MLANQTRYWTHMKAYLLADIGHGEDIDVAWLACSLAGQ